MSEFIPPTTTEELEADLINTEFAAYLYIGEETDLGWKFARTAFALVPRLRIYLAKDRSKVVRWAPNQETVAIVFGWDDTIYRRFSKAQAEDLQLVLDTIVEAMK